MATGDLSPLEAYDLVRFAETFEDRLAAAQAQLGEKHPREQSWLAQAIELVREDRETVRGMLDQARLLPELGEIRAELADDLKQRWVDALEKLLAGITFHAGSRAPVIEALFPHQKFPALRRVAREGAEDYAKEFERRLGAAYVTRIFGQEEYGFVAPVVAQVKRTWSDYASCFGDGGLSEDQARPIRESLVAHARKIDLALRQARLLAEAALAAVEGAYEAANLGAKPKRRSTAKREAAPTAVIAPVAREPEPAASAEPTAEAVPATAKPSRPKKKRAEKVE